MRNGFTAFVMAAGIVALGAFGGGCGGGGGSSSGTLVVGVSDAPFPVACFAEATVTISGIELQAAGAMGNQGFIAVLPSPTAVNLLDVPHATSTTPVGQVILSAQVPPGRYHMIRLRMTSPDAGVLTFHDGETRSFTVPSGEVKIVAKPDIVIVGGQTTTLNLDFDLPNSFHINTPYTDCADLETQLLADPSKVVNFRPVCRATNKDVHGIVEGVVKKGDGSGFPGVTVTATDQADGTNTLSTLTGDVATGAPEDGFYALFLEPGTYDLTYEFHDPSGTVLTSTVTGVTVETGKVTNLPDVTLQ
jgi:hypothetical protein